MGSLDGRVAVITGAGRGIGREHALLFAKEGARVVVNDLGGASDGSGDDRTAAEQVVDEIRAGGGEAVVNGDDVSDWGGAERLIAQAVEAFGSLDVLVNNAGILRDKSFSKMSLDDFRNVIDVHLMGSVYCTKAVWDHMKTQGYGRIVLTTSSSGLYGNFGQANYAAAKLALVGLMQTLALEGAKYNVRVNCLAPSAGTRMLDGLMPEDMLKTLHPSAVSPGVLALVAENAPTRAILCAGGGSYEQAHITLTRGIYVGVGDDAAEGVAAQWPAIGDRTNETIPSAGFEQSQMEFEKAKSAVKGPRS
jgi:NAD(P)-dependent dehydrogenase (short-subunit alcohol dehydrogenase family)